MDSDSLIELLGGVGPNIVNGIKNFASNVAQNSALDSASHIEANPILADSFSNIITFNSVKNIIILLLVLWGATLISVNFMNVSDKTKEDFKYVNKVLFGDLGIIPMIAILVILVISITTIIPAIVKVTPSLSTFLGNLNATFQSVIGSPLK
jgi:hypothetical protein